MATSAMYGRRWSLDIQQDWIDVTSEYPTPDERWKAVDLNGHPHKWDHGYPTLVLVIDREHWCDGTEGIWNHDPHMTVDESHYECLLCRAHVEPGLLPGGTRKQIPGMRTAILTGVREDGVEIVLLLLPDELDAVKTSENRDEAVQRLLTSATPDRTLSMTWRS